MVLMSMSPQIVDRLRAVLRVYSQKGYRIWPFVMRRFTQTLVDAVNALAIGTSRLHWLLTTWVIRLLQEPRVKPDQTWDRHEDFARDVERLLGTVLNPAALTELSVGLQKQFRRALISNPNCMLPSYNHQLPDGTECGK